MTFGSLRSRHFLAIAGVICVIVGLASLIFAPWSIALMAVCLGVLGISFAAIMTPNAIDREPTGLSKLDVEQEMSEQDQPEIRDNVFYSTLEYGAPIRVE